jgi:hypothetical protein
MEGNAMQKRRRVRHEKTFEERLAAEAIRFREAAEKQPPGSHAQALLLRRARQAETASHINEWLKSPGLRPPKEMEDLWTIRRSKPLGNRDYFLNRPYSIGGPRTAGDVP